MRILHYFSIITLFSLLANSAFAKVEIRAKGIEGGEQMELRINDNGVQTWTVDRQLRSYVYYGPSSNFDNIKVAFINDQGVGVDLQVDYIEIDGVRRQAENQRNNGGGRTQTPWPNCIDAYTELLPCNGYIEFKPSDLPFPQFELPVEVIGANGHIESRQFYIHNKSGEEKLWIRCHRCAYRDSNKYDNPNAKGQYRVNGGGWTDISQQNVLNTDSLSETYGGLNGAFYTVDISLPIRQSELKIGQNTIDFKFKFTDGITSGYRITEFAIREDGARNKQVARFSRYNPNTEPLPFNGPYVNDRIANGRNLWYSRSILEKSPVNTNKIKASCADCHAQDGRDLKYFGFSNKSVIARSEFHGLNNFQAKEIAAFIRSHYVETPPNGRPWNPPYQPTPGIDSRPASEWAAGGGLRAVLSSDADLETHLFPNGRGQNELDNALSIKATLNMRELPVPFQLPDWNAWLPEDHPMDLWDGFESEYVQNEYQLTRDSLGFSNGKTNAAIQNGLLPKLFVNFRNRVMQFGGFMVGPQPCIQFDKTLNKANKSASEITRLDSLQQLKDRGTSCERGLSSLNQWHAVKVWEIHEDYGLQDKPQAVRQQGSNKAFSPYAEARGWHGDERSVFDIAAHRSANNSQNFSYQTKAVGAHHSNSWYWLQMVINPGYRDTKTFTPQDWFYTGNWLAISGHENKKTNLAFTFIAAHLKMMQNLDLTGPDSQGVDTEGPTKTGWWIEFIHPWRLYDRLHGSEGYPLNGLDAYNTHPTISTNFRRKVVNAFMRQWLDKTKSYPVSSLPRRTAQSKNPQDFYEPYSFQLRDADLNADRSVCYFSCPAIPGLHARDFYQVLEKFKAIDVDANIINETLDWLTEVYPESTDMWEKLR